MAELSWVVVAIYVVFMAIVPRRSGLISASTIFMTTNLVMALGTLPMLDVGREADRVHAAVICVSLAAVAALLVAASTLFGGRFAAAPLRQQTRAYPATRTLWILIGVSFAICIAYYGALGYNVLFLGVFAYATGTPLDITALRLDSYSGPQYLFPGYVNQFRNVLLPALSLVTIVALFRSRSRLRWWVSTGLILANVVFMLGTGQRGAFVTFMLVTVTFIAFVSPRAFWRWMPLVVAAALPLFLLATFALGRAQTELDSASGPLEQLWVLFGQLAFRILGSNQEASVAGFRYIYDLPTQWGGEWLQAAIGLLPGLTGSDISNQIHAELYGSDRGTAPLSVWGSTFYNFGFGGVVVVSILLALALHAIDRVRLSAAHRNSLEVVGAAGIAVVVGTWVASDPTYLLNVGAAVFAGLWFWGRRTSSTTSLTMPLLHWGEPSSLGGASPLVAITARVRGRARRLATRHRSTEPTESHSSPRT
ncbi:oligosaccharide repeat unit polymerase [Yonghaparkia sp. Soil809]|uniref:oligosaccharide repeat unit polymerase n=1 Tax=Yonghaparkia sp. Soil809 TaxID=1736417 RepID=UPI0006F1D6DD|nr:oligosaccharide repeat unit polymerase [Yonghaparkia sp. Soil809]KRF33736.1 hypothetical protein ASG83_07525 [Yonghaparkia sp. Soil809]